MESKTEKLARRRGDLIEAGISVPIGHDLYWNGTEPVPYRWADEDTPEERFQIRLMGSWFDANCVDFDFDITKEYYHIPHLDVYIRYEKGRVWISNSEDVGWVPMERADQEQEEKIREAIKYRMEVNET